jgi:hypothetical protein
MTLCCFVLIWLDPVSVTSYIQFLVQLVAMPSHPRRYNHIDDALHT